MQYTLQYTSKQPQSYQEGGGGKWRDRPGQQNPNGRKMNISSEKKWFSSLKKIFKLLSHIQGNSINNRDFF
jgi:hypothetical protein